MSNACVTHLHTPMQPVSPWIFGAFIRRGLHHPLCQDAIKIQPTPHAGLTLAVADGVSAGVRGDIAADTAVSFLSHAPYTEGPTALAEWLRAADTTVATALATHGQGACTCVALWLDTHGAGWLTHMGDCRAYRYSPETGLEALTVDHSYTALGLTPPPGVLNINPAYMLGLGNAPAFQLSPIRLQSGDSLLLCSDGLHGYLDPAPLANQLRLGLRQKMPLGLLAESLAELALQGGSEDDIAIALAHFAPT